MITHYGLFRPRIPANPMIKDAAFFEFQGGLVEDWGNAWEPIHDCRTIGDARRKMADKYGATLSQIYQEEP